MKHLLLAVIPLVALSCSTTEPQPTPEELAYRNAWSALVPPQRRALVEADAARHTSWALRKKVVWEGQQYQHIVEHERHQARATQPTTKGAALAATGPTTRHLATTRHFSTTMHVTPATSRTTTEPAASKPLTP